MVATAQTREELHDQCVIKCESWLDVDLGQATKCYQACENRFGYGEGAPRGDPNGYWVGDGRQCYGSMSDPMCGRYEKPK